MDLWSQQWCDFSPAVLSCLDINRKQKLDPSKNRVWAHGFDGRDGTKMLTILVREVRVLGHTI